MRLLIAVCLFGVSYASIIQVPRKQQNHDEHLKELADRHAYIENYISSAPRAEEEDARFTVPELIQKYGYPFESHTLTSSDGYILTIHRIPHGKSGPSEDRPVVYLQHGILASSADWVISGPEKGFAYLLADRGYDVWMGNVRGNRYSRNHTTYSPDDKEFWDYSWHEIAVIDIPAMIDLALATTKQEQVYHIGHSQGTTAFYVMCAEKPEYNEKIRAHYSLAPIAYMNHLYSPLVRLMALAEGGIDVLLQLIGMHEFLPTEGFLHNVAQLLCKGGVTQILCKNSLFMLTGFNKDQLNTTLLPILMAHTPAGSSSKQLLHYGQLVNSGKFRQYDFGMLKNMKIYGSISPPKYDLKKVTAPIYLLYSHNDWLSAEKDVLKLYDELPNVKGKFLIADDKWNHLDYCYGIDAPTLVYNKVFSLMNRH